ncbi:MAG: hypothetical protein U5J83_08735 [Bryobacterales bacterium]|nr:hypothetical protein [Bryobacterales bacterium]
MWHPKASISANLVDFDMLFGHRNDVPGYARALEAVDVWLPSAIAALREGDLLLFCADHGCDPTTPSTDHSREFTPLLCYCARWAARGVDLGIRRDPRRYWPDRRPQFRYIHPPRG